MVFADHCDRDTFDPDAARQPSDLDLAAAISAFVAFVGQKQESLKIAAPIANNTVDLAGDLETMRKLLIRPNLPGRPVCAPGRRLDRAGLAHAPFKDAYPAKEHRDRAVRRRHRRHAAFQSRKRVLFERKTRSS